MEVEGNEGEGEEGGDEAERERRRAEKRRQQAAEKRKQAAGGGGGAPAQDDDFQQACGQSWLALPASWHGLVGWGCVAGSCVHVCS